MTAANIDEDVLNNLSQNSSFDEYNLLSHEEVEANLINSLLEDDELKEENVGVCTSGNLKSHKKEMKEKEEFSRQLPEVDRADITKIPSEITSGDSLETCEIKLELTCEPEQILEQIFEKVYFDGDNTDEFNNSGSVQIEISSSEFDMNNYPHVTNDLVSSLVVEKHCSQKEYTLELDDNYELLNVMSDHNYTSQERTNPTENFRQFLTNYIANERSCSTNKKLSDFVDKTIENINSFRITGISDTGKNTASIQSDILQTNGNCLEASEKRQILENANDILSAFAKEELDIKKENRDIELSILNISPPPSPQDNCSEPLEHSHFEEAFDLNYKKKVVEIEQLDKLVKFANELLKDCATFSSSTTDIENKLQKYLQDQLKVFKNIINISNLVSCVEKSVQTEKILSKRKLKKLNKTNKDILLNTTDSSSAFSDSSVNYSASPVKSIMLKHRKSSNIETEESTHKEEFVATEYDDGVPLVQYTQSEIFDTEMSDDLSRTRREIYQKNICSDDSDSTERNLLQNESDKENVSSKFLGCVNSTSNSKNGGDKQIERLINLNGLTKRPGHNSVKISESTEKTKATMQSTKKKSKCTIFEDDDIQQEINSDNSISEEEEEITEKEYLARLNENIKRGLLTDSSADNIESDESNDMEESFSNNERSNSPLVERFLKKFDINESNEESEGNNEFCETRPSCNSEEQRSKININQNKQISLENSDWEVLDDDHTRHKKNKSKSLEKMLSDVEKRKKMNKLCGDLISLSSESENSDVEAVEDAKSRIIKPMLRPDQLASETRKAQREEADRIRRIEKKQKTMLKILKEHPEVQSSSTLILDYNEDTKTFIKVLPDIVKHLKPHQIDGIKFMYDSCYGGLESLKKHSGSGCILAHCMGLGKTLQLIALLHTVITYKELKTSKVLVLCPKSTVMNWADEIKRWLGSQAPKFYTFNDASDINDKLSILQEWSSASSKMAGILLIGYEAFRTLVFYHSYKNRGIIASRLEAIRSDVEKYLLNPGADLVVCDEGHIIKNSKSAISLAVSQIITPKRIVLTGTPIQNNLKEYYSMVNFIKPLFLGTEKEFANLYANPIKNGQHKDSSKRDIKVMKQRSFVLHKKLSKFVQRKEAELLKTFLPKKYEYVLFIPMTAVQNNLYEHILSTISKRDENRGKSLITDYTCLRKIWTHPKVLEDAWKNATNQRLKKDPRRNQVSHSDDEQPDDIYDSQTGVMSVTNDWWRSLLSDKDLETLLPSNKLRTMFEILRMCEEKGEKCLIFSAFVAVLNVVEYFFKKINDSDSETRNGLNISESQQVRNTWVLGKDYYRLDGKTPKVIRHEMVENFNNISNKRARVFLISARAGGQGINLIGANRVIILDTSWNPSNDQQNIFRIFRLGQKKNCYIYRLLAMGTMEEKVYSRSVTKQAMSFRVVDEQQIDRHYNMAELGELYSITVPNYEERQLPECPQDSILASLLYKYPHLVFKYHEHDSLLENKVEQELSEQEKADAWSAYERELQINSENREFPCIDEFQNNFSATKMQNYLTPPIPGFDMSSFFNYGNFSNQPAFSPFLQPLVPQCTYPTANQSYLDIYKRLAQNPFPFSDMSTPLGSTGFHPPFTHSSSKSISANPPLMSESNGKSLHSNPLSALGDLSLYGLGAPAKNICSNVNATNLAQRQHNPVAYTAPPPSSTNMLSFEQYRQTLESSLKSLSEYTKDHRISAPNLNKSKTTANINQFQTPFFTPQLNVHNSHESKINSSINLSSTKNLDQQQNNQIEKSYNLKSSENVHYNIHNKNDTSNINTRSSSICTSNASVCSPVQQLMPNRTFTSDIISISAAANLHEESSLSSRVSLNTQPSSADSSANLGLFYSTKNVHRKSINEHPNSTNEVQIIPTSNTFVAGSTTKQLNEISPSISLTALNGTNRKNNKSQTQNCSMKNKTNHTHSNTINNKGEVPHVSHSSKKLTDKTMDPITSVAASPFTSKYSTANASVKTVSSALSSGKNAYQHSGVVVDQPYVSSSSTKTRNTTKNPQNLIISNSSGRNLSPVTTNKMLNTFQTTNVHPTSTLQSNESNIRKTTNLIEKKSSANITTSVSSNIQTQRRVSSSTLPNMSSITKEPSITTGKNVLNIRPIDKKSPSKSGVYIIETNINQKKVAIGVPTKSGGGTTVTKVPLQKKRKLADVSLKDIATSETKRFK